MKKIFTLCLFVFAMFLGTESLMAQTVIEVNAQASEKTEALRKYIKFNTNQRDLIYDALKEYVQANADLKKTKAKEGTVAKIEKQLNDKMKAILTEEQFERYKTFSQEN